MLYLFSSTPMFSIEPYFSRAGSFVRELKAKAEYFGNLRFSRKRLSAFDFADNKKAAGSLAGVRKTATVSAAMSSGTVLAYIEAV